MDMISALRANEGLIIALALCVGGLLVLALISFLMRCSRTSLRPIFFVGAFMVPILLTFLIGQLVLARMPPSTSPQSKGLAIREGQFADRAKLFGSDVPAQFIREAKSGLPGILDHSEIAEAGVTLTGETILVAQFPTDEPAKQAVAAYHRGFQLRSTSGDEENGWRAKRGLQSDFIEMLRTGRHLFVWSGATPEACAAP